MGKFSLRHKYYIKDCHRSEHYILEYSDEMQECHMKSYVYNPSDPKRGLYIFSGLKDVRE